MNKLRSKQEAFDTTLNGVVKQGGASVNEYGHCSYRSPNGRKCGIGHLIPDNLYDPSFEGQICGDNDILEVLEETGYESDRRFLASLQVAHDGASHLNDFDFLIRFKTTMQQMATLHNLEYKEPINA